MTTPHHSNLEDLIHEDSFDIKFYVQVDEASPCTGNVVVTASNVFGESPFIIPCDAVLQDVPEFLRRTVPDCLSERDTQILADEIISYYEEVRRTTLETTNNPCLIPLEVSFYVGTDCDGNYIPFFFVLESVQLLGDHQELVGTYEPVLESAQLLEDDQEFAGIYEAIDQSMQQLSLVPASPEAVASPKRMKAPNEQMKAALCIICLENFEDDDQVLSTPCRHVYHYTCIAKWLKTSHTCPLCRYQMST